MKYQLIPIPSIQDIYHTEYSHGENALKFTNTRKNCLTKTNKMLEVQGKKYTNQIFNDVAFPK